MEGAEGGEEGAEVVAAAILSYTRTIHRMNFRPIGIWAGTTIQILVEAEELMVILMEEIIKINLGEKYRRVVVVVVGGVCRRTHMDRVMVHPLGEGIGRLVIWGEDEGLTGGKVGDIVIWRILIDSAVALVAAVVVGVGEEWM